MTMQHRFLAAAAAAFSLSACGQSASPALPSGGVAAPASGAAVPALSRSLPAAQPLISAQHGSIAVSQRLLSKLPPREASEVRRVLAAIPHSLSGDYVLAIPGIDGSATMVGYKDWNQIDTFTVVGAPTNSILTFTRREDQTTPPLLTDLFSGQTFSGAEPQGVAGKNVTELAVVQPGPHNVVALTLTFGKPIATSFTSGFGGEDVVETWTIQFQTLKLCVGTVCNTTDLRG